MVVVAVVAAVKVIGNTSLPPISQRRQKPRRSPLHGAVAGPPRPRLLLEVAVVRTQARVRKAQALLGAAIPPSANLSAVAPVAALHPFAKMASVLPEAPPSGPP